MADHARAKVIKSAFSKAMREAATGRSLKFSRLSSERWPALTRSPNTYILLTHAPGGSKRYLQLIYIQVKTDASKSQRYDWAPTGNTLKDLRAASRTLNVPCSVVMLLGGATFGYCLSEDEMESRRPGWDYHSDMDEYGVREDSLPSGLLFRDLEKLFALMNVSGADTYQGATPAAKQPS